MWVTGQAERAALVTDRKIVIERMNIHKRADRQTDKLGDTVNLPPKIVCKADVSSFSPSSGRIANA